MLLIAAPGQGAQAPGFLREWLEVPGFAERLEFWSELAGCDLIRCGTTADADEITGTDVAQPLLVAAAIAAAAELVGGSGRLAEAAAAAGAGAAAGHSVGELAAGAIAGALAPDDAIRLVRVRGQAMAGAAAARPTGMTAVLGGDESEVLAAIEASGLTPANVNGAGQIVAAGTMDQLAAFAAGPPPRARLRPLSVAGAFHTVHMAPAVDALREAAATVAVHTPLLALLSNRDGSVVRSGRNWLERIVTQVSAPVRWDLCLQTMTRLGVTALIELPPAGTLTGLARRGLPGVQALGLKGPGDLDAARELLAAHAAARAAARADADAGDDGQHDTHAPDWRLLVAPLPGTFRAGPAHGAPAGPGAAVSTGAELGHVEMRGGRQPVSSAFPATIIEWLVEDGDPVTAGQPLVRLQPEATGDAAADATTAMPTRADGRAGVPGGRSPGPTQ
jgi:[acyl-carrier-protein] S-malonyltransferase